MKVEELVKFLIKNELSNDYTVKIDTSYEPKYDDDINTKEIQDIYLDEEHKIVYIGCGRYD